MHIYTVTKLNTFEDMFKQIRDDLLEQDSIDVGEWQSQKKSVMMRELRPVIFDMPLPATKDELATMTGARLPWAEDHFLERVSGEPLNPAPSEAWWPFRERGKTTNESHKSEGEAFSHTYPERMWPKLANGGVNTDIYSKGIRIGGETNHHYGIRFEYGDLMDVVNQLEKSPFTRQAYLPIWFPEDTGAVHGKRVPCTLGYHFQIRDGHLDITYFMRSTDLLRHFQDDVYLAGRLAQWMVEQLSEQGTHDGYPGDPALQVGKLIFHTANMHIFEQDENIINFWKVQDKIWY